MTASLHNDATPWLGTSHWPLPEAFVVGALAGGGEARVISDCHFSVQLNHFIPVFVSYSVAVFLK